MSERKVTYLEAVVQALREEMRRDETVLLIGEQTESSERGFNVSANLLEEFGSERVITARMAEGILIGSTIGAAFLGMRPIAEMQLGDVVTSGFNQLLTIAGEAYSRIAMPLPLVIRGATRGSVQQEPITDVDAEDWLLHLPTLKVVAPSTIYDAKGLLKAAVRDNDPVLYLEHEWLYWTPELREALPVEEYTVPLGKAVIRRDGEDLTMLAYGAFVHRCLQAARMLEEEDNLEAEVLDLRSLTPLDRPTIIESVKRTNKLLLVYESMVTRALEAEVATSLAEEVYEYLEGPITSVNVSTSLSRPLQAGTGAPFAGVEPIVEAARKLAAY